jgi:hypothetical protein
VPRLERESRTSLNKKRVTDDLWRREGFPSGTRATSFSTPGRCAGYFRNLRYMKVSRSIAPSKVL